MSIFIIYIGIIGLESHFDRTNFKASLVIETINSNRILKMAHLLCESDYLSKFQSTTFIAPLLKKLIF
jgi:hypothetical protein